MMDAIVETDNEVTECGIRFQHNVNTRITIEGEEDNEVEAEYGKFLLYFKQLRALVPSVRIKFWQKLKRTVNLLKHLLVC